MDFFATANTACVGTDTNATNRVEPNAGAAFNLANPDSDRTNHGPVIEILGQGAQPGNGADFRGFVALDVRNYLNATSQLYYNDVPSGVTSSVLKDLAARWIYTGGYPGPASCADHEPAGRQGPDRAAVRQLDRRGRHRRQRALRAGRHRPRARLLGADPVHPGLHDELPVRDDAPDDRDDQQRRQLQGRPQPVVRGPGVADHGRRRGRLAEPAHERDAHGRHPALVLAQPGDAGQGQGTSVDITNAVTAGATTGIYTLWLKGQAGSPYLTTKYFPMAVQVGNVQKDFAFTAPNGAEALAPTLGSSATFTLNLKAVTNGNNAFNTGRDQPLGRGPSREHDARRDRRRDLLGRDAARGADGPGNHAHADHRLGLAARGPVPARHPRDRGQRATATRSPTCCRSSSAVVTGSSNSNTSYVDVTGYGVMRIASITSNTVYAYAISPVITDPNDSRLRLGQVARLVAWN